MRPLESHPEILRQTTEESVTRSIESKSQEEDREFDYQLIIQIFKVVGQKSPVTVCLFVLIKILEPESGS